MGTVQDREARVVAWLEENLGGKVRSLVPQPRWRPVWWAVLERKDGLLELCVRGDRVDTELVFPLEHEMLFQRLLYEHGIPVPRVHGWIDEPRAIVMDRVPGVAHFEGASEEERRTVVDEYLQVLARMHALDIAPFVRAGVIRAQRPEESGLVGISRYERVYRAQKRHPEPLLEFFLGWLRRHPPHSRGREAPVVWDSGQFHHLGGHLGHVLDLELGHLGDPMMDLAAWRQRDTVIGFGDFKQLYARYEELSGAPVDLEAIQLHHVFFCLTNSLVFSHALRDPPAGSDLMTNMQWCNETNLFATEALAEYLAVELPGAEMPEPRRSRGGSAHRHLVRALQSMPAADEYLRHQIRISFRLARHLQRLDEIGDAVSEADLDDLHALLGRRPRDWFEGEAELERFVLADSEGRHDEALVRLFHRRNLRAQMLNGPAGSAMARHLKIQSFR
jgi:aminoglycoside phosphotransferase (APT) family kinase protein